MFRGFCCFNLFSFFSETECYYGAINGTTLPIPTFDQYTYVETIYKNNRKVYHWTYTDSVNNLVEDYYDTADDEQDPVLFVVTDNTNISVDTHYYTEFDTVSKLIFFLVFIVIVPNGRRRHLCYSRTNSGSL